jgi:methyl-accepting chemotaxis protein
MRLSLRQKFIALGALTLLFSFGTGIVGYWGISSLSRGIDELLVANQALRNHLEGDMMHDALRGDVLASLIAGESGYEEEMDAVRADLKDHAEFFRTLLKAHNELPLAPNVKTALVVRI